MTAETWLLVILCGLYALQCRGIFNLTKRYEDFIKELNRGNLHLWREVNMLNDKTEELLVKSNGGAGER